MSYAAIAVGVSGIVAGGIEARKNRKALKFKAPQTPPIKDLVVGAVNAFKNQNTTFIANQIASQKSQFGDFFDIRDRTIEGGRSLLDDLLGGQGAERRALADIRSAQALRGASLSPAAAVEEGLAVSEARQQSQLAGVGLGGQLAQLSAATPLGVQQLGIGDLLSTSAGFNIHGANRLSDAQISNINMQRDDFATRMALMGRLTGLAQQGIEANRGTGTTTTFNLGTGGGNTFRDRSGGGVDTSIDTTGLNVPASAQQQPSSGNTNPFTRQQVIF